MHRCEAGDLSGKHGMYNIGMGRQYYTDMTVALFGESSGKISTSLSLSLFRPSDLRESLCKKAPFSSEQALHWPSPDGPRC